MSIVDEVLPDIESLLDHCKDMRQHYMEEALDKFRINSRDLACFYDGKFDAYDKMVTVLESIIENTAKQ